MQFGSTSSGADSDAPLACRRIVIPMILVAIGTSLGLLSIALVSNRFGNTDWVGLLLFPLAGGIFATGVAHLFLRLPSSALLGIASTPIWAVAPFVFYWAFFFATAFQNRHHQDFAVNGVSQIAPAAQMDELFKDCRHYITYGPNNVPLFNSVAYFGDRYELTMQVPVEIESDSSGSIIGAPNFYLNETSAISVSPTGQIGASFSRNLNFGPAKWRQVYNGNGDFGKIGFVVNPTPVPNFKTYTDACRPSN